MNVTLSLAARRTVLLALVLRSDACLRDRVVDVARRNVDEVCDSFSQTENTASMIKPVLWPTDQLRAAVYGLFDDAENARDAEARETRRLVEDLRRVVDVSDGV